MIGQLIGARMRELRKEAGLTIEVARRMGSHRPIVGRFERGIHDQGVEQIVRYARAIGVRPTTITVVLDDKTASTVEDGAACMVPEESSGRRSPSSVGHETQAASSSAVDTNAGGAP